MEKKKTPNVLPDDPVSQICQKTGFGRVVVEEQLRREQAEKTNQPIKAPPKKD